MAIADCPVSADRLGGLIDLIADGTLSGRIAKDVFDAMFDSGQDAAAIVEETGLKQISDTGALSAIVDGIIDNAPAQRPADRRGGKERVCTCKSRGAQ